MTASDSHHCGGILADAHVHIYRRFSERACFDWAVHNFNRAASRLKLEQPVERVLFLTESADHHWFAGKRHALHEQSSNTPDPYVCISTEEPNSLYFETESSERIWVIAGRQIVSRERLEVLALGLVEPYADGQPLKRILADLRAIDCISVLPWGAGKWTGKRRRLVETVFRDPACADVFLGDSGNRPYFWRYPGFSDQSGQSAPRNLPGSDPLPLNNQERRIGSYGFMLKGPLNSRKPFNDLRRKITEAGAIETFGRQEQLLQFLYSQTAMQLRNH
jgi:hypothetical protein